MKTLSATFADQGKAVEAVRALQDEGFDEKSLLVVTRADEVTANVEHLAEKATRRSEEKSGAKAGSVMGAAIGGTLGVVLTSFAVLPAIPLAVFGGAMIGAISGTAAGSNTLVDEQLEEAKSVIEGGGAMVFVQSDESERLDVAEKALRGAGASQVLEPVELEI